MAEQAINGLSPYHQDKPVILIADDSRVVRVSLKNILKNDCQLIEAEDGLQAWELLLEHPDVRLIFSDLSMPHLDGRHLLKKIRQSEINRIRNLPFIVVTGIEEDRSIRQELQDSGATEVINKPFDPASIISIVSTLVSKQEEESYFILGEELAQTQFLPGIVGQSQFLELAGKELSFAIRNKNELALALLKIDQFERINRHYSEPAVEHILLTTAEIMRHHIHPDDTMAYFGGGLFAILRPASNAIGTRYIGRRVLEDLKARQFYLGESDETVGASIGISAPEIKQGTRLRELLLLAEGRLKAAMDLGGDRVIDKGNDTLTPVSSMPDTSLDPAEHSRINSHPAADASAFRHSARPEVTPSPPQDGNDPLQTAKQIAELRAMLDLLTQENKGLQEHVERWRKQSAESEQLRQRVFELESEQQQMQLKFNRLNAENLQLTQQAEQAEREIQQLVESEEDRTATLKQANQFYAEENQRLEGQLDAVNNRAQKAESANLKSGQLIVSLKDNISLLRGQLEMVQQQLTEAQRQPPAAAATPKAETTEQAPDSALSAGFTHEEESSLLLDGFPTSELAGQKRAPVVQMFPPRDADMPAAPKPAKVVETAKAHFTLPIYRMEDEQTPVRVWHPPSSFAIASLILLLLLAISGGYLYSYLKQDSLPQASLAVPQTETSKPTDAPQAPLDRKGSSVTALSASDSTSASMTSSQKTWSQPLRTNVLGSDAAGPLSEEARLQAELTLRQMAEEAFYHQLQQMGAAGRQVSTPSQTATFLPGSPTPELQSEAESAPIATDPSVSGQLNGAEIGAPQDLSLQTGISSPD